MVTRGFNTIAELDTDSDQALRDYVQSQMAKDAAAKKPKTQEEEFTVPFFWQDAVIKKINSDIKHVANLFDMDLDHLFGWFDGQQTNMLSWIQDQMAKIGEPFGPPPILPREERKVVDDPGSVPFDMTQSPGGIERIFDMARQWVSMYFPGFRDAVLMKDVSSSRRGGSRRPTAEQIRAQFDLDQLTALANEMSQALVLAEAPDARQIAKAYVESIVANPEQELDFKTYVRNKILSTARAKTIYRNKPESMSEEQFLQPYVAAFQSLAGPGFGDQMATTATAGARLGASPAAFQQRLTRTSQVQTSTPFLSRLGQRLNNFAEVMR